MSMKYPAELSEAAAQWIFHPSGFPMKDDQRVIRRYGPEILSMLKMLNEDYNSSVGSLEELGVQEILMQAQKKFTEKHPDVPCEVVKIFSTNLAYDLR